MALILADILGGLLVWVVASVCWLCYLLTMDNPRPTRWYDWPILWPMYGISYIFGWTGRL